jgi:ABC-type amino acid transport system permease subunit
LAGLVYLILVSVIVLFARAIERRYFIPSWYPGSN